MLLLNGEFETYEGNSYLAIYQKASIQIKK